MSSIHLKALKQHLAAGPELRETVQLEGDVKIFVINTNFPKRLVKGTK